MEPHSCKDKGPNGTDIDTLSHYLAQNFNAYLTGESAKCADVAQGYEVGTHSDIVVFHYSRANGNCFCWSAFESMKDGWLFSPKYSSTSKRFPKCHVIVMANQPPETLGALSADRVKILNLDRLREINPRYFQKGPLPKWPTNGPLVAQLWSDEFSFGPGPGSAPSSVEAHVKSIW